MQGTIKEKGFWVFIFILVGILIPILLSGCIPPKKREVSKPSPPKEIVKKKSVEEALPVEQDEKHTGYILAKKLFEEGLKRGWDLSSTPVNMIGEEYPGPTYVVERREGIVDAIREYGIRSWSVMEPSVVLSYLAKDKFIIGLDSASTKIIADSLRVAGYAPGEVIAGGFDTFGILREVREGYITAAIIGEFSITLLELGYRTIEKQAYPTYSPELLERGIEGSGEFRIYAAPDGEVLDVEITQTSGWPAFDKEIRDTLLKWKFNPIEKDGVVNYRGKFKFYRVLEQS